MIRRSIFPICLLLCQMASGQSFNVRPQNDMYKDLTLYAFVTDLKFIIATKDKQALLGLVDSNIKLSFGEERGIADFRRMWMLDKAESPIWGNLSRLIRAGATMDATRQTVCFPYIFTASIPDSIDLVQIYFVTGDKVAIRQRPDPASAVLGYLSNEVVYRRPDTTTIPVCHDRTHAHYYQAGERQDWKAVANFDKTLSGFVYWDYLWSPFDYRMFVTKKNDKWKITCLIAGE